MRAGADNDPEGKDPEGRDPGGKGPGVPPVRRPDRRYPL